MALADLDRQMQRTWDGGGRRDTTLPGELDVGIGLELRTPSDRYDWHGLKRGRKPYVVIQYTLAGWGMFTDAQGRTQRVDPGMFFLAMIPSEHRYHLPRESPTWRFFYLILHHPWVLSRLSQTLVSGHAVQMGDPQAPFVAGLVRLWTAVRRGDCADDIAMERMQMEVALEHDRLVRSQRVGLDERDRELAFVREFVAARPDMAVEVAQVAKALGLSRSAYAHRFATRTGLSPARYIAQLRLDLVRRDLLAGDDTLAEIADRTGFADANHLCKVFRRHFHQSPGQYRRQMGG